MHTITRRLAAATLALLIAATPAAAQRDVIPAPDPFVHREAGVAFPATVAGFERGRVVEYDADGADASVGYRLQGQRGEMTVYVYPAGDETCRFWFEDADRAVRNRPGATRQDGAAALRLGPDAMTQQFSASYTIPPGTYGYDHAELVSYLWVGCVADGKWVVKYRGSFLAGDASKAERIAERLFAAIDWTPLTGG